MTESVPPRGPMRREAWMLLAILALAGGYYGYLRFSPREAPAGQPSLVSLGSENLQVFKERFNTASDRVRVLVMLSPT